MNGAYDKQTPGIFTLYTSALNDLSLSLNNIDFEFATSRTEHHLTIAAEQKITGTLTSGEDEPIVLENQSTPKKTI